MMDEKEVDLKLECAHILAQKYAQLMMEDVQDPVVVTVAAGMLFALYADADMAVASKEEDHARDIMRRTVLWSLEAVVRSVSDSLGESLVLIHNSEKVQEQG